jgi:hypothetical protein
MSMSAASHRTSEASHSQDGTKTIGQLNRELQEIHDGQPATARCAWCRWTFEGSAVEAREAFAFHRSSAHPDKVNGASARDLAKSGPRTWTREEIIEAIQRWAREHDGKPPTSTMWMKSKPGYPQVSTVINRFGSWSKGIAAAEFEKPTRGGPSVSPPSTEEPKPEPADPPPTVGKQARKRRTTSKAKPPAVRKTLDGFGGIMFGSPEGSGSFAERCEVEAARHESAAAAYKSIAVGVRTLEELGR